MPMKQNRIIAMNALGVITRDRKIREFLQTNDPIALKQAQHALDLLYEEYKAMIDARINGDDQR